MDEKKRYNLTLRQDDGFEARLGRCLARMPKGYPKQFFIRAARLFARQTSDDEQMFKLMMDFVTDVKPNRLAALPQVGESDIVPPMAHHVGRAAAYGRDGDDELSL